MGSSLNLALNLSLPQWFFRSLCSTPPCLLNPGSCFVGSRRKDKPICSDSPCSRSERKPSGRLLLTGLFIFEKGSGKAAAGLV